MSELGHNSGLSPEEAAAAMERALAPHEPRAAEIEAKAKAATVDDHESAQAAIDFIRMARALGEKARDLQTEIAKPYKDAADAARGVALQFIDRLEDAAGAVNAKLADYNKAKRQRAAELARQQQEAEEALRRRAAEAEGKPTEVTPPPAPEVTPEPARSTIRTNLGGRLTETKKWRPKVVDVTKVPAHILNSPKVIEAIEKVARPFLANGIDVPGVTKDEYDSHTIA